MSGVPPVGSTVRLPYERPRLSLELPAELFLSLRPCPIHSPCSHPGHTNMNSCICTSHSKQKQFLHPLHHRARPPSFCPRNSLVHPKQRSAMGSPWISSKVGTGNRWWYDLARSGAEMRVISQTEHFAGSSFTLALHCGQVYPPRLSPVLRCVASLPNRPNESAAFLRGKAMRTRHATSSGAAGGGVACAMTSCWKCVSSLATK